MLELALKAPPGGGGVRSAERIVRAASSRAALPEDLTID